MTKKRIALMASENLIKPLENQGCEVFWTFPLVYSLFYEGKDKIELEAEEFKKRLCAYKDEILQFKPIYFFTEQWFFSNLLSRLEHADKREIAALWADFITGLTKNGIVTIIFCQDDPVPFRYPKKQDLISLTYNFDIVATHSLQMQAVYKKQGQEVIYFPLFIDFDLSDKVCQKEPNKVDPLILKFDLFFMGNMNWQRKIFFRRLSRKVKGLDYFFGSAGIYYTSRENIGFNIGNKYYLSEIYRQASINIVYGSCADSIIRKTWGITHRIFNIAYCNGFFLCDYRKHLTDLFDIDPGLYSFKNVNECYRKIKFYLEHGQERKELADKFNKQVTQRYTADKVMGRFIDELEKAL